jgi:general stress protein 26
MTNPSPVDLTSVARVDLLLAAALKTIAEVPYCWAATPSADGGANVRLVGPIPGVPGEEDWTIWLLTERSSRKAAEIQRAGLLTLGYQRHVDNACVALSGKASLIEDRSEIRSRWIERWRVFFSGGPDDPNAVFVRMNVDRIELCIGGVTAEPFGLRYSVIERGDDRGWRVVCD